MSISTGSVLDMLKANLDAGMSFDQAKAAAELQIAAIGAELERQAKAKAEAESLASRGVREYFKQGASGSFGDTGGLEGSGVMIAPGKAADLANGFHPGWSGAVVVKGDAVVAKDADISTTDHTACFPPSVWVLQAGRPPLNLSLEACQTIAGIDPARLQAACQATTTKRASFETAKASAKASGKVGRKNGK